MIGTARRFLPDLAWAVLALLALAATPAPGAAAEVPGTEVRLPPEVSLAGRTLVLNGAGLRKITLLKLYVAALYLPEKTQLSRAVLERDSPRSLRLVLLRDLSTDQNLEGLKDGMVANNSAAELGAVQVQVNQFLALLKGLHEVPAGSVIQIDYLPGEGTRLHVDARHIGTVPGAAFNRALLRIWLGEAPIQASLKQALLGG